MWNNIAQNELPNWNLFWVEVFSKEIFDIYEYKYAKLVHNIYIISI